MKTTKRLLMRFKTTGQKICSIAVDNPREDLTEFEIKAGMTMILASNVFLPNGEELHLLVDAKIVTTNTNEYELA